MRIKVRSMLLISSVHTRRYSEIVLLPRLTFLGALSSPVSKSREKNKIYIFVILKLRKKNNLTFLCSVLQFALTNLVSYYTALRMLFLRRIPVIFQATCIVFRAHRRLKKRFFSFLGYLNRNWRTVV